MNIDININININDVCWNCFEIDSGRCTQQEWICNQQKLGMEKQGGHNQQKSGHDHSQQEQVTAMRRRLPPQSPRGRLEFGGSSDFPGPPVTWEWRQKTTADAVGHYSWYCWSTQFLWKFCSLEPPKRPPLLTTCSWLSATVNWEPLSMACKKNSWLKGQQ